jgi:hypothetical protein
MATIIIREAAASTQLHCYVEFAISINKLESLYKQDWNLAFPYKRVALDDNIYIFGKSGVTNINDAIATLSSMIKRLYGDVNIDVKHNDNVLDKLVEIYKNNYKLKLAEHVKERRAQSKLFYNN